MSDQFLKDPQSILDYQWNWASWLVADTISTATVTASSGLTVASSSNTTTTVTAWLSGGTIGQSYSVTCEIVTAGGRTDDRTITIVVMQK